MLTGMPPQVLAKRSRKGVLQYKVRWKNYGEEADTWEPLDNLDNAVDQIKAYHDDKEAEKEAKKSACNSFSFPQSPRLKNGARPARREAAEDGAQRAQAEVGECAHPLAPCAPRIGPCDSLTRDLYGLHRAHQH